MNSDLNSSLNNFKESEIEIPMVTQRTFAARKLELKSVTNFSSGKLPRGKILPYVACICQENI